jgi:hypothetical protein
MNEELKTYITELYSIQAPTVKEAEVKTGTQGISTVLMSGNTELFFKTISNQPNRKLDRRTNSRNSQSKRIF